MFLRGRASAGAEFSFIGPEVSVAGDVSTPGELHIAGTVTGDVRCGRLVQAESGAVHGNIQAGEARLAGLVDGAVEAGALTLEASARVTGDVLYDSVGIARGAEVEGRFRRRREGAGGSVEARAEVAAVAAVAVPKRGRGGPRAAGLFGEAPTAEAAE
ncbi:MAG TPA: polymer-forming cytoskeletal protein [Allosphingosinicella sp.]